MLSYVIKFIKPKEVKPYSKPSDLTISKDWIIVDDVVGKYIGQSIELRQIDKFVQK
jgi:hypothetical protein